MAMTAVRAPHTTRENTSNPAAVVPRHVFGGGCGLRREGRAVGGLDLGVAVGGDQRGEEGHEQEERGDRETGDQHALLPALDRHAQFLDDRDLGPERRLGADVELGKAASATWGRRSCSGCGGHLSTSLSGR